MMHTYCDGCGVQVDPCWEGDNEVQFVTESWRPDVIPRAGKWEALAWALVGVLAWNFWMWFFPWWLG